MWPDAFIKTAVVLAAAAFLTPRAYSDDARMIRLAGTPEQIGTTWGEINKQVIAQDLEASYLKQAKEAKISRETLIERSAAALRIIEQIAPHWIEEARAVARAADVPEDLYLAYMDGVVRSRFLGEDPEECTSYAVSRQHTRSGAILFHKTRDNRDVPQSVYIMESFVEGIHKFIAVSNATGPLGFSMMVNEKGLAGAGDYPPNRKKDSSTLRLEPAPDKYRGIMSGTIMRHIAETASTCDEALAIIERCVDNGWYSGGKVGGTHWLFVDREGTILEVWNNSGHVASKIHTQQAYFSRLNKSPAARRLREAAEPVDFHLFHGVSRDPSICFGSSISGMTVEIDPDDPGRFTTAWIALPTRAVAFPLMMGQSRTPRCLVDGSAYELGKKSPRKPTEWQVIEQSVHADKERFKQELTASIEAGNPEPAHVEMMDRWSQKQALNLMNALKE
jgi:hypothetical protein